MAATTVRVQNARHPPKIHFASRIPRGKLKRLMPTPICPKCRRVIPADDINVAQDVAYCRGCNASYRLSNLTFGNDFGASVDLNRPPPGAWCRSDGGGTVIGAVNRSPGLAFGGIFIALFWNAIVSVFVYFAVVSTLHHLHVPLPAWLPVPKSNGGDVPLGLTIFLWLFLTPFIAIGLYLLCTCLSVLFGRTEARIEGPRGTLFTGFGPLGWHRQFDASQVKDVRLHESHTQNGNSSFSILLETRDGKQFKFGSLLRNERRQFVLGALQRTFVR
jgi:hypothetical protein